MKQGASVTKRIIAMMAAVGLAVTVGAVVQIAQEKGGGDETGPYDLVAGWPQNYCGAGHVIGSTAGIWAESPDRVYIFSRGCLPELKPRAAVAATISSRSATHPGTTCRRRIRRAIRAGTTSSTSSIATAS